MQIIVSKYKFHKRRNKETIGEVASTPRQVFKTNKQQQQQQQNSFQCSEIKRSSDNWHKSKFLNLWWERAVTWIIVIEAQIIQHSFLGLCYMKSQASEVCFGKCKKRQKTICLWMCVCMCLYHLYCVVKTY